MEGEGQMGKGLLWTALWNMGRCKIMPENSNCRDVRQGKQQEHR